MRIIKSKKLYCYEYIKKNIISNSLQPGEPINEIVFSKILKTSRTPVREALIQLQYEGFISNLAGKGYFVSNISIPDIKEIYELREILECGVIMRAALKADQKALLKIKKEFQKSGPFEDLEKSKYFKAGDKIHNIVFEIFNNKKTLNFYKALQDHIFRFRNFFYKHINEKRAIESFNEHVEILDSLLARDPIRAEEAMKRHLQTSMKYLTSLMLNI